MELRTCQFRFRFPRPALVMGIVNVTPDSFSDGGQFMDARAAEARGLELEAQGAEIIDLGGESTRPGAAPVEEREEMRRVIPVIKQLSKRLKVPISIDTMKPVVARAALDAGASIVNDVGANREDEAMWLETARAGAGYVCVHAQGTPQTMQVNPSYADVSSEVERFFVERLSRMQNCGVALEQVILDPGIGFGKTLDHNLQLLGDLRRFAVTGRPLLVGVSRKSFMGKMLNVPAAGRLPAGLACAILAVESGVQIVRTHDVAETVQALRMAEAILAKRTELSDVGEHTKPMA